LFSPEQNGLFPVVGFPLQQEIEGSYKRGKSAEKRELTNSFESKDGKYLKY